MLLAMAQEGGSEKAKTRHAQQNKLLAEGTVPPLFRVQGLKNFCCRYLQSSEGCRNAQCLTPHWCVRSLFKNLCLLQTGWNGYWTITANSWSCHRCAAWPWSTGTYPELVSSQVCFVPFCPLGTVLGSDVLISRSVTFLFRDWQDQWGLLCPLCQRCNCERRHRLSNWCEKAVEGPRNSHHEQVRFLQNLVLLYGIT